jgi:HTH-type transcriptional regulator / antitoxin HipB
VFILTHGFEKKSTKTPRQEIERAETYRRDYLNRKGKKEMSDLEKYIAKRKKTDKKFAEGFQEGYEQFKIGVILGQARESAGLTQEEPAVRLKNQKTAISRIENHAGRRLDSGFRRNDEYVALQLEGHVAGFRLSPE